MEKRIERHTIELRHLEEMKNSASGLRVLGFAAMLAIAALAAVAALSASGEIPPSIATFAAVALGVAALVLVFRLISLVFACVVEPLAAMRHAIEDMSKGQLIKARKDFGKVSGTTKLLGDTLTEMNAYLCDVIGDMQNVMYEIAHNGDFKAQVQAEYKGDFEKIAESVKELEVSLIDVFSRLVNISGSVLSGAQQVAEGNTELANGSSQQTADAQQLFSVITEMSEGFRHSAANAKEANVCTGKVNSSIVICKTQMEAVSAAMDHISEASSKIDQIIKTINQIAFQTNILALNAAVEAARAGEAGKGFAVVADEVRMLANNTAEAADETTELIRRSLEAIQTGIKAVAEMESTFENVGVEAEQSTGAVNTITRDMESYVEKISAIKEYTSNMVNVIERSAAIAENSQATCEELYAQVGELDGIVRRVKI